MKNLSLDEIPVPVISPEQILIKVSACGINFPDLLMIEDKYQVKPACHLFLVEKFRGCGGSWV
ncbi:MAG: hypothetical protein IPO04_08320 [Cytophagaceae bacterium]|nr:hypothetical protein [Cytophagaceae bacterium]